MNASKQYSLHYSQNIAWHMTGVHVAGVFGLKEKMAFLFKNRHDPDSKDSYGRTPLSRAAENGHEAVAKLLLEKGAELESSDDEDDWTPLS
jgi:ankyrin repeat protein